MNGLERIKSAIAHRESDVVPFDPYVSPGHALHLLGYNTHEMYLIPGLLPKAMINATKFYESDIVYCRPDPYMGNKYYIEENQNDNYILIDKNSKTPKYEIRFDNFNLFPLEEKNDSFISNINEIEEKMPIIPANELIPELQNYVQAYTNAFGNKIAIFAFEPGVTIKVLKKYRGFEKGLMDLYDNTNLVETIMWRRVEQLREYIKAFAKLGCHGYYTGDSEASCSLISPSIFRSMLKPIYKAHIKDIKDAGLIALLHICGKSNQILEDVADIGADIFESLDPPSLGGNVDLADAKNRIGDKICLKGNIDAPGVIEPGPSKVVYDICTDSMRIAAKNGGYILSTEQITPSTKVEHVLAMSLARKDFKYRDSALSS